MALRKTYFETLALLVEVEGVAEPDDKDQIEDAEEGSEDGDGCPGEAHQVDRDCLNEGRNGNYVWIKLTSKTSARARR